MQQYGEKRKFLLIIMKSSLMFQSRLWVSKNRQVFCARHEGFKTVVTKWEFTH